MASEIKPVLPITQAGLVDRVLSLGRKKMASEIKPVLPITQAGLVDQVLSLGRKKMASEIKPVLPIKQAEKLPFLQEPFGTASTSNPERKMDHPGVGKSGSSSESDSNCKTDDGEYIEIVTSVEEMLSGLAPRSEDYCIFRVPAKLREGNNEAYTPQVVSIGPLHHGKPELIGMEEYKMTYLKAFLDRTKMSVETCLKLIRDWEKRARSYYAESISLNLDEFAKMVLVDSGFIIESILRYCFNEWEEGISGLVRLDLILVENQLPFFILQAIFDLAFTNHPESKKIPPFREILVSYFKDDFLMRDIPKDNDGYDCISNCEIKHFVDLLRIIHVPRSMRTLVIVPAAFISTANEPSGDKEYVRIRTATELQEADMKIKCRSSSSSNFFLDMSYNPKGVLEIPKFRVTDSTESMLRNLIALEVLLYQKESYIIDCVVFMDGLIDTARDVDVLVKNGVMDTYLGESEAVANMFNRLTLNVGLDTDKYHFCDLSKEVNKYCNVPRHKWMGTLKRDYFSTPFKVVSIIGAIVLLVLTLIQAVCSVISLYR